MDSQSATQQNVAAQHSVDAGTKELTPCSACCTTYHIIMALLVRLVLLVHALLAVWVSVTMTNNSSLWALSLLVVFIVVDAAYSAVRKKGKEGKWFCRCFLAYLAAVLPPVWLIELNRLGRFQETLQQSGNLTDLATVSGLTVPIKLEPDLWVSVIEQTLLFLLVLCRWLLPRGDITRQDLSQLLFVFLGIASDNMSLFQLFDEPQVRSDTVLTYVIMCVWSLSFVQFLFVLTTAKNPQRTVVVHDVNSGGRVSRPGLCEAMFTTEIWSLLLSGMTLDGPYAVVRIYTMAFHSLITYSIIYFTCKNLFVICLITYRLVVVCLHLEDDDTMSQGGGSEKGKDQ